MSHTTEQPEHTPTSARKRRRIMSEKKDERGEEEKC